MALLTGTRARSIRSKAPMNAKRARALHQNNQQFLKRKQQIFWFYIINSWRQREFVFGAKNQEILLFFCYRACFLCVKENYVTLGRSFTFWRTIQWFDEFLVKSIKMPFDSKSWNLPKSEGLYEPTLEKDACGVGFIVNIEGKSSHQVNKIIWFFSVWIFLLRFYVKSKLAKRVYKICRFNVFFRLWIWIFVNSCTFLKDWNLSNWQNSEPQKWQKRQILELLHSLKLISRKI